MSMNPKRSQHRLHNKRKIYLSHNLCFYNIYYANSMMMALYFWIQRGETIYKYKYIL